MSRDLSVKLFGCRGHHLKGVDVAFPMHRLTVVTGPSGAGKSSLVFDTLHAESRRRYLESFSSAERHRLETVATPALDRAENLPLTVAVREGSLGTGPRNTLGSETGLLPLLQMLFAEQAQPRCDRCAILLEAWTPQKVVRELAEFPDGTRLMLGFVLPERLPIEQAAEWVDRAGFSRVLYNEQIIATDQLGKSPEIAANEPLVVIADRIKSGGTGATRLRESLELCFRGGRGAVAVFAELAELAERTDWQSATIDGSLWLTRHFNEEFVCPNCARKFPDRELNLFRFTSPYGACSTCHGRGTVRKSRQDPLTECPECRGDRLNRDAAAFEWNQHTLPQLCRRTIAELREIVRENSRDDPHLANLRELPELLDELGLGPFPLELPAAALSSGEATRIALAQVLANPLNGSMSLLDDPTAGVSVADGQVVLNAIDRLLEVGITICAISDDARLIERADCVIRLGPESGVSGGEIVFQGTPAEYVEAYPNAKQSSAQTNTKAKKLALPALDWRWSVRQKRELVSPGITFLTGPLAARPTALFHEQILAPLNDAHETSWKQAIPDEMDVLPLSVSSRTPHPRQMVVSALKVFGAIRQLFAETDEARKRNVTAGEFSLYKTDGVRCPTCEGTGQFSVDLDYLPDLEMVCADCGGERYQAQIEAIRFRGLSLPEVLSMTADDAFRFFKGLPPIQKKLQSLRNLQLGYLHLGQSLRELSKGERQRLELAAVMKMGRARPGLLLLVEPSSGLSNAEVDSLAEVFREYALGGQTIFAVDYHPRLLAAADKVIELTPK